MDDTDTKRIINGFLLSLSVLIVIGAVISPVSAMVASGAAAADIATAPELALQAGDGQARHVILMIGDGMGATQVEAARWEKAGHDPAAYRSTALAMDGLSSTGTVSTASADNAITDSAAAATALMTGTRTNNGVIGQDATAVKGVADGAWLETIAEKADAAGLSTGAVTTVRVTHATPAGVYAHVNSRDNELLIASQFIDADLEVALGGGYRYFVGTATADPWGARGYRTDGRNLITEARAQGYTVVTTAAGLSAVPAAPGTKVLGLFSSGALAYEPARASTQQPSLAAMTEKALAVLSTDPDGFFLMVEGGQIDLAAHDNNYPGMTGEVLAFDDAVATALAYTKAHPDTLLIVTADHETGGLARTTNRDGTLAFAFTSAGHTAVDVPIRASGPGAERFAATTVRNTQVFEGMRDVLGLGIPAPTPTTGPLMVPGSAGAPTDTDGDGRYDDANGNGRRDFADTVLLFDELDWITANEPVAAFDFNGNAKVDFADVVWLFTHI